MISTSDNKCNNFAEREVVVGNKMGLHRYQGEVSLIRSNGSGEPADCHSVLSMLILAAGRGTRLTLRVEGDEAQGILEQLGNYFDRNFDEESE